MDSDLIERHRPPFEFTSDMLFAVALCPTAPLRRAFPQAPFLSLLGWTPLLVWFSWVAEGCAHDAAGEWRCERDGEVVPYGEVTAIVPLRRRAFFCPGIYAGSAGSTRIARHYYGMPKHTVAMRVSMADRHFEVEGLEAPCRSQVRARVLGGGRFAARVLSALWPLRAWPVRFPAGTEVRGSLLAVPRAHLALVRAGRLAVDAPWLPVPGALLPVALYAAGLRMRLP